MYFSKFCALAKSRFKQDFFFTSRLIFCAQIEVKLAEVKGAIPKVRVLSSAQFKRGSAETVVAKVMSSNKKANERKNDPIFYMSLLFY